MCARVGACVSVRTCMRVRALTRAYACARVALIFQHDEPPYYHLQCLLLRHNFQHYLINGTTFGKTLPNIKCVF
jgi:hypothetical protein